jgi:hypothetical protein
MSVKQAAVEVDSKAERETFANVFPGAAPPVEDGRIYEGRAPRETAGVSEAQVKYFNRLIGAEQRLRLMGVVPTTVLNMNPYQLKLNSTLVGDIVIAPCPKGRPYSVTVLRQVRWSREDDSDGIGNPIPWVPIHYAREFEDTYYLNGGVVVYQGDGEKVDPATQAAKDPAIQRNMEAAKARLLAFAREKVREANNEFNTPNRVGARNINDIHRSLAALLHDETGQELPVWIEKVPGQHGLGFKCKQCAAVPNSEAILCPNCGYVLDPRKAFEIGSIDIEDVSLTRLERPELEAMGISELIEETVSERNERIRDEAAAKRKGKGKGEGKAADADKGKPAPDSKGSGA